MERRKETCPLEEEHKMLMRVIFGDDHGDMGMKKKVDAIYDMLVQVNGVGNFLKWVIVIGAALAALRLWIIR